MRTRRPTCDEAAEGSACVALVIHFHGKQAQRTAVDALLGANHSLQRAQTWAGVRWRVELIPERAGDRMENNLAENDRWINIYSIPLFLNPLCMHVELEHALVTLKRTGYYWHMVTTRNNRSER